MKERYNPETHEYFIDERRVPSVTGIVPKTYFYCDPETLENARLEGIENHAYVKMYLDTGDTFGLQYLEIFKRFMEENPQLGPVVRYEEPLYSRKYRFAGTPDMEFQSALVDLKRTFGNSKYHALQLAGYAILTGTKTRNWYILVIDQEADTYKLTNVYDKYAIDIFKGLLQQHEFQRNFEIWRNT